MGTLASNAAELAAGLVEAAAELGNLYGIYRPATLAGLGNVFGSPIVPANLLHGTLAAFPRNYGYTLPIDPLKPHRVAILDPAAVQPGDYASDGTEIYFIGATPPLQPIDAVLTNCAVSVLRQTDSAATPSRVGSVGKLGNVGVGANISERLILQGWPASVLYSGRGAKPGANLPSNDGAPQWTILLPKLPVTVAFGDILTDDTAETRRFTVLAAEQNASGVRIIANQAAF